MRGPSPASPRAALELHQYGRRVVRVCSVCGTVYAADVRFCGRDGGRLVAQDSDPWIGRTVARHLLKAPIGWGAVGAVYQAYHLDAGYECAVKILFGDAAHDRRQVARLQREATAMRRIMHPNVVMAYEHGITPEGTAFLAMELIRGCTLHVALGEGDRLGLPKVASIARQIADGLSAAHAVGFVHRDLKPGNIMLERTERPDRVKILDFGVASTDEPSDARLTDEGFAIGTPTYMAPEQTMGSIAGPEADLYALGVILHEMLTGRPLYSERLSIEEIMRRKLFELVPAPPLAGGLGPLALRLMLPDPEDRPRRAADVVAEIDEIAATVAEASEPRFEPGQRPTPRDELTCPDVDARFAWP